MEEVKYDLIMQFLLVGDQETGKSSVQLRYADDTFPESYIPTIGVEFRIKQVNVMDKQIQYYIWDSAGQEKFRTISTSFFKQAHGIFIVFDFSNRKSFENLDIWFNQVKKFASENVMVMLIGNKSDLIDDKSATLDEARKYAEQKKVEFFEVSAQQQLQIDLIFNQMAVKLLSRDT